MGCKVHANFDVDGVEFKHADGTMEPLTGCGPAEMCLIFCTDPHGSPFIARYDHIYMFDRVFSRVTLKALAARLQAFPRVPSCQVPSTLRSDLDRLATFGSW